MQHGIPQARMNMTIAEIPLQDMSMAVSMEAKRISEKYDKDVFSCEDLMNILAIGKNSARELLNSDDFPTLPIGGHKKVSAIGLAFWMLQGYRMNMTHVTPLAKGRC